MKWIMVDIEANGPIPGDYSMIELGAIYIDPERKLDNVFYGKLKPLVGAKVQQEALDSIGRTHEETLEFYDSNIVMNNFKEWLKDLKPSAGKRLMFISDNNGFDFMFVCWYFWHFCNENPFGHSSTNLGSLYKGCMKDFFKSFKHLRKTKHTHNPVDDARGNVEALLEMIDKLSLKFSLD